MYSTITNTSPVDLPGNASVADRDGKLARMELKPEDAVLLQRPAEKTVKQERARSGT